MHKETVNEFWNYVGDENMSVDHNRLKELFLKNSFIISNHARVRMFQRKISTDDIRQIIEYGK